MNKDYIYNGFDWLSVNKDFSYKLVYMTLIIILGLIVEHILGFFRCDWGLVRVLFCNNREGWKEGGIGGIKGGGLRDWKGSAGTTSRRWIWFYDKSKNCEEYTQY